MTDSGPPKPARLGWLSRRYELFLAFRILRARRRAFLSVVGFISALGVVFGVTALTVILTDSGGFQEAIRGKVLGFYPDLVVLKRAGDFVDYREVADRLRGAPHVEGVTPATYNEMMAAHGERRAGVVVKGVDLSTVQSVTDLNGFLEEGATLDGLVDLPDVARKAGDDGDDGRVAVLRLVAGTAVSVVALPGGSVVALPDDPSLPDAEHAKLRILHALPGQPALVLALDGPTPEDTFPARLGAASRYIDVEAGARNVELRAAEGGAPPLASLSVEFVEGYSYTVVAAADGAGQTTLRLLHDAFEPPDPDRSQVRLVHADSRASGLRLSVDGGAEVDALTFGEAGPYRATDAVLPGILVGGELAERLHAKRGDVLTLVTPLRGLGSRGPAPFGMAPTSSRFRVAGVFHIGYYEYDTRFVIVSFAAARRFLNRGDRPRWLEVRIDDSLQVKERRGAIKAAVDPYDIFTFLDHVSHVSEVIEQVVAGQVGGHEMQPPRSALDLLTNATALLGVLRYQDQSFGYRERFKLIDWEETYRYLFSSLKLQKVVLGIFFLIIVLVASFNIIGSQVMVVHEKLRAIAILRSMGASRAGIRRIFLFQGMVIGVVGTSLGLLLGWLSCLFIGWTGFYLDPKVYYISKLPVAMEPWDFAVTGIAALLFSFLASRYSANKAAQRTPVEGLRRLD